MMALDVYKQIIGQQNMSMGAVISILLLLPAVFVFIFDRIQSKRHARFQAFQAKPYVSASNKKLEVVLSIFLWFGFSCDFTDYLYGSAGFIYSVLAL